jgi:hypothetical protein
MIKNKKNSVNTMLPLEVNMAAQISNAKMPKSVFAQMGYETPLEMYENEPTFEVEYHPTEVPLNIMLRQSMAESSLRPHVVSGAGAIGLTQIRPGTLKDYIKATGHKDVDLYNYKDAMAVQNWYMNDLYNASFIDKPDQSDKVRMAKTLASYNWGRGNMLDFLTRKKEAGIDIYSDDMAWLQDLPDETREYLDKVLFDTHEGFQTDVDSLLNDPNKKEYLDAYGYEKKDGGSLLKAQIGYETLTDDPQVYIDNYNKNVDRNNLNLIESRTNDSLFSWDYWFGVPSYEESIYFDKDYDPTDYTRATDDEINTRLTRSGYSTNYNFINPPIVSAFSLTNKKPYTIYKRDEYIPQSQRHKLYNDPTAIELSVKDYMTKDMASKGFVNRLYKEVSRNLEMNSDFNELSDDKKQEVLNSHVFTILQDRNLTNQNLRYVRNFERSDKSGGTMFSMKHRNKHPFIRLNPISKKYPSWNTEIAIHEGFHGLTHENYGLTQYAYDVLRNAKYTPDDPGNGWHGDDLSYLSDPTEVYVSKKNTENWLREKGIWDSQSGDPFTREMFDTVTKMVEKGKAPSEVVRLFGNDEVMYKGRNTESFNKKISWEDANLIMNTVAFQSPSDTGYPQEELDIFHDDAYAQHGGAIRSAQEGEEVDETFTPQPGMYDPDQNTYLDLNDPNVQFPPEEETAETDTTEEDDSSGESKTFSEAFAEAEAQGLETFTWNGKEYKVAHPENGSETTENTPDNTETTEEETDVTESDEDKEVSNTQSADDINAEDHNLSSLTPEQKEYLANTYGKVPHPVAGTSTGVSPTAGVGKPGDLMDLIYTVKGIADRFKSENYVKRGKELYRAQQGTGNQFPFNEEWSPDQPDSNIISNDQSNNNDNIMQDAPNQEVQNQTDFSIMGEDDDGDGIPNSIDADTANPTIGPQPQPGPDTTDNQDNFPFDDQDPNQNENTEVDPNEDPGDDTDGSTDTQTDTTETTTDDGGGSGRWQDSKGIQTFEKISQGAVDAARFANAFLQRRADRKRKQNMKKTTLADNVYQTTEADVSGQKGDYDANTGIFRKDDKVIARQGKYGTELSKFLYSDGGRTEQLRQRNYHDVDTTLDLDEDTILELMAAGAEIEYL